MSPRRVIVGVLYFTTFVVALGFFGALLPREHVAMETAELPAPPESVYAVLRNLEAAPTWRSGLARVEVLPKRGEREIYREHGDHGPMTLEIVEDIPNRRFVTAIADLDATFGGRWVFELTPTESGGTRLTLSELGDIPNPLVRFLAYHLWGFDGSIAQYMTDLRRHLGART